MTPQDIRERSLEKALFNGYDMGAVDRLREECAEALAGREKEIATLKAKMRVLVDSIEGFRATEEEMRRALLQAKTRADEIVAEAQAKADQIVAEAEHYAKEAVADADAYSQKIVGGMEQQRAFEEERLLNAQTSTVNFIEEIRGMCMTQLGYLDTIAQAQRDQLPEQPEEAPAEEPEAEEAGLPIVEVKAADIPVTDPDAELPLDGQFALGDAIPAPGEIAPEAEPEELIPDAIPADDATKLFHITTD